MKVYWWRGKGNANFGDVLTAVLLRRLAAVWVTWAPPEEAELFGIGSVIERVPVGFGGTILGTGKAHEKTRPNLSKAQVLAVRGPLTLRASVARGDVTYGDLGLLASKIGPAPTGEESLGIIPHYADRWLAKRYSGFLIDVLRPVDEVIEAAARCQKIVSSSLHGIILADALGLPRRWESYPKVQGHGFKFHDYGLALGEDLVPGRWGQANRSRVERIQSELLELVETLRPNDRAHWRDVGDRWPGRNEAIARLIPGHSSVLDLGAGARSLGPMLPSGCTYQAADLEAGPDVWAVDFNKGIWPQVKVPFDIVVMSGALEYAADPVDALQHCHALGRSMLVSYAAEWAEEARQTHGWAPLMDFEVMGAAAGWTADLVGRWKGHLIYRLEAK